MNLCAVWVLGTETWDPIDNCFGPASRLLEEYGVENVADLFRRVEAYYTPKLNLNPNPS